MLFSFIPTSQAELFDFIIELDGKDNVIQSGESVVVSGRVVDHAYKATRGIEVVMKTGGDTVKAFTDPDGIFRGELKNLERNPGTYSINIIASWYGKVKGITNTQFQVEGEITPVTILQQKLATNEAKRYLSANESDFEKNPIGQMLFKYYHGVLEKLHAENKKMQEVEVEETYFEGQRKIADELKAKKIEEHKLDAGTHGGMGYEDYISGLKPEIRDLVVSQMNHTKNTFQEAQTVRDEILANGGTYEEAREAYLELVAMSRESLEKFNDEQLQEDADESSEETEEPQTPEE